MAAPSNRNEATAVSHHHEHHHSGHGAPAPVLTSIHCSNCGVIAPALLVNAPEPFSAKPVADVELATHTDAQPRLVRVVNFAASHPPDTSPPPGISPLRI